MFAFSCLVTYPLQSGALVYAIAQRYRGQSVGYTEAIVVGVRRWPYLMPAYFISMVLFGFGLALLIIPGILVLIYFALIDQQVFLAQCGPIQALRQSAKLVKGPKWLILGVFASVFVPVMAFSGGIV